ncbi:hypothetical protein AW736_26360 [Termitidicoccus mucosus]|uniref:Uncharacterized protein n=1 Tax=Termitidicoccus mucosus TaxID=1184151 RepID=A0A178IRP1_9BACT|nr:hypothetical protein AW736_26360 [Opitutaceae bacterium TSB47]
MVSSRAKGAIHFPLESQQLLAYARRQKNRGLIAGLFRASFGGAKFTARIFRADAKGMES